MTQDGRLKKRQPQRPFQKLTHIPMTLSNKFQARHIKRPVRGQLRIVIMRQEVWVFEEPNGPLKIGSLHLRYTGSKILKLKHTCSQFRTGPTWSKREPLIGRSTHCQKGTQSLEHLSLRRVGLSSKLFRGRVATQIHKVQCKHGHMQQAGPAEL